MLIVLALVAGMGWLYLLRDLGWLDAGPRLAGALPLEQLARADDQPLARIALAWLPAGAVAGLALAAVGTAPRLRRGLTIAMLALVLLFVTGATADAIAISADDVVDRIPDQAANAGAWAELALIFIGSLAAPRRSSTRLPGADEAAAPAAAEEAPS